MATLRRWLSMWNALQPSFKHVALIFILTLVLPFPAFAQYPSEVEINLPEPPQFVESLSQKAANFLGVQAFVRELQRIDFYELFARGRRFTAERITRYQSEIRKICPANCNLLEIILSAWNKAGSLFRR